MNDKILNTLNELIKLKSITPNDNGCQKYIYDFLKPLGFEKEIFKFNDVSNIILRKGNKKPVLSFVGHTDVVPVGDESKWSTDPFNLEQKGNKVFGRGVADMKGSIACMMCATEDYILKNKNFDGTLLFIFTSDEEGIAVDGIQRLVKERVLDKYNLDYCLVGEPTSKEKFGDTIKNGRRGSLSGELTIKGLQGHIAYPQNTINPIHLSGPILNQLISEKYDEGDEYFTPTSFQISNINAGYGVENIIPGEITIKFNFRYSNQVNHKELIDRVENILDKFNVDYQINWKHSGEPYLTTKKEFLQICKSAVENITGITPVVSTDGGTSDGRFIAKICNQVIEFGLLNDSIHKIDEHTNIDDLVSLSKIYKRILSNVFN
ncbi:MAG: succinyl-diaminopimelate desuccinylase [Gammaproteobacteria bacterium]|nr:succinyl-diaminopimelate desuccinylase [Gammaproteobacteria bacterium]